MSPLVSRVSGGGAGRFFNKGYMIRKRIGKPNITFPTNGSSTNLAVAFTSSAADVVNVTHAESDWQIATDSGFANIINSTTSSAINKTAWEAGATYNGTLYARVRYKNVLENTTSDWSDSVSFTPTASISSSSTESITASNSYAASVTANNTTAVSYTYTWKKDSTTIGTNSSSLSHTVYMYDQSKVISCQITTPGCSTTYTLTRPSLTIANGVTATKNGGATVTAASNWSASITSVTGTPYPTSTVSYQWQFDGTNFSSGGTTSSVSFASFYSDSGKTVSCIVRHTDTSGSGQSTTTNFNYTMTVNRGALGPYGGYVQQTAPYVGWNNWTPGSREYFSFTIPANWWSAHSVEMICGVSDNSGSWNCYYTVTGSTQQVVSGNAGEVKNASVTSPVSLSPGSIASGSYQFNASGNYYSIGAYYYVRGNLTGYQNDTRSTNP